jgi:calcium/calmodulin-dependent protein kinase I
MKKPNGISLKEHLLPQPPSFPRKKAYEFHEILGEGSFGKVIRATWTPPPISPSQKSKSSWKLYRKAESSGSGTIESKNVALKVIPKKKVKGHEEVVWGEMEVLKGLDHPNIVS